MPKRYHHDYENSVTVITPTRRRVPLLRRALQSVTEQDCEGIIEHLILIDDCMDTLSFVEKLHGPKFYFFERDPDEISGPARLAKLRNTGIQRATSRWIAFLDDDNEFDRNHLSSLLAITKTTQSLALHAQSRLYNSDGSPYLEQRLPWYRDKNIGRKKYSEFCALGIVTPGSNILRSHAPKSVDDSSINLVDTNEWMIDRRLLLRYPFIEHYDLNDWENIVTEDDKLLSTLINNKVNIVCTQKATVKYYLGGYSNYNIESQMPGQWVFE